MIAGVSSSFTSKRRTLRAGDLVVEVAPECGGSITRFGVQRPDGFRPLLRDTLTELTNRRSVLGAACFPLIPYSNRLREGRFSVGARVFQHPLEFATERHSSHGDAWLRPWSETEATTETLVLDLPESAEQPIAYHARQVISVSTHGLVVRVTVTNRSAITAPFGLGLHPYFVREADTRVCADLPVQWDLDDELMPLRRTRNTLGDEMRRGIEVAKLPRVAAYQGSSMTADIVWPSAGLRLRMSTSPAVQHMILWCPEGERFFCLEPVSHAVDAFNLATRGDPDTGVRDLNPDESWTIEWSFLVVPPQ